MATKNTKRHENTNEEEEWGKKHEENNAVGIGDSKTEPAMTRDDINELCDVVRQTAFDIHYYHRHGHLEKVYENALAHRLRKRGLEVFQQHPLAVLDEDGTALGNYFADLFVESRLIVELKACQGTSGEHVAQLLGYLKSSRIETGLLINFGATKLYVKKFLMSTS